MFLVNKIAATELSALKRTPFRGNPSVTVIVYLTEVRNTDEKK